MVEKLPIPLLSRKLVKPWDRFVQILKSVQTVIGLTLIPVLYPVLNRLADMGQTFARWMQLFPNIARVIGYAAMALLGFAAAGAIANIVLGVSKLIKLGAIALWKTLTSVTKIYTATVWIASKAVAAWNLTLKFLRGTLLAVRMAAIMAGIGINLMSWPVLLVIGAIGLLAAGCYLLIKHWDDVQAAVMNTAAFTAVAGVVEWLAGVFSTAWQWIKDGWNGFINLLTGFSPSQALTATLWRRSPSAANEVAWVNTSGDTYDIYINIGQYAYWLIAQYDYTGNANVTLHSTPEYSSAQPGNSTSGQTYTLYNSLMKPTAGDVEALSVNGGRLNGALGIGTDNALGGNSIVFGDNDTGFKWHSDGVLGIYANNALVGYIDNSGLHMSVDVLSNGAIRAGNAKKLSLTSNNNSALTATFNLWGDPNRPTVIELNDDQGWHLYSQRNPDGSIVFTVNGDITANTLRAGGAIYQNNGDIFGSLWGNGWLSTWIHNNVVKAVRLGPVALSGGLWRDFQLGGGQVVTGFHTDGSWEMEGDDDKVYYRPIQYLIGDTWVTAPSV